MCVINSMDEDKVSEDSPSPYPYQKTSESLEEYRSRRGNNKIIVAVILALIIGAGVGYMGGSLTTVDTLQTKVDQLELDLDYAEAKLAELDIDHDHEHSDHTHISFVKEIDAYIRA